MPVGKVRVSFDKKSVKARIKAADEKAIFLTAEQALKDCNQYVPKDQGDLIRSSEIQSQLEKGLLIWSTPYARYQYYGVVMIGRAPKVATDTPLKYTRSGARKMWAHYARSVHGEEWREVYNNALKANL
ncbi:MAG: minor capsid family protein [Anaerocolumna sp.]|jgi:hypothetical protein|nr:minor capsid family protein [Anaerocolumna sp.]